MDVFIARRDVEITADGQVLRIMLSLLKAPAQSRVPLNLVLVRRRTDCLSVRRVDRKNADVADRYRDRARMVIRHLIAQSRPHIAWFRFRKNGDAIVRFLAMKCGMVSSGA